MPQVPTTTPVAPSQQRDALLDAQRQANQSQPRNFKEDALDDKVVTVAPDGTGPTSTESFDPSVDQTLGSGNATGHAGADGEDGEEGQGGGSRHAEQPDQGKVGKS